MTTSIAIRATTVHLFLPYYFIVLCVLYIFVFSIIFEQHLPYSMMMRINHDRVVLYIVPFCVFLQWAFAIRYDDLHVCCYNVDDVHDIGWCVLYGGISHPSTKCLMIIYILGGYTGTSKKYSKHSSSACAKKNRTLNTACSHY